MTNREHIQQQLSAYLDGELDAADASAVEQALAGEPELARELDQLKATRELLRRLPIEHAPEDFASRVLAQTERRSLVHPHAPARQGINWLRYSLTAAVALIALSVGIITLVGIYSARKADRNMFAQKPALNAPAPDGETVALMDKTGGMEECENGGLRIAAKQADRNMKEGKDSNNNVLICVVDLPDARKELESQLGKNSIQYQSHWAGDEEAVIVADVDSSQVSRLNKVISDLRSSNIGAELSGRQLRQAKCQEQAAADLRSRDKSSGDETKDAGVVAKDSQKGNGPAKKIVSKPGGGWSEGGKLAQNESADTTPGAGYDNADGGRPAKNAPPHGNPEKPAAAGAIPGTRGPTTRPAAEDIAAPALAANDPTEHSAQMQQAPPSAPKSPGAPVQNAVASSQARPGNMANQSNQLALRVQITLQYHPALTQGFGAAQNRNGGPTDQNFNQSSQSCPTDGAASQPDNPQQNPNR